MSILRVRMLMHLLTCIIPVHVQGWPAIAGNHPQLSVPPHLHPSWSPKLTQSLNHTSPACESALTQLPWSLLWLHLLTLGHSQKMTTSFTTRDYCMSLITRTPNWLSSAPAMTTALLATQAFPSQSRTSVISSIGP